MTLANVLFVQSTDGFGGSESYTVDVACGLEDRGISTKTLVLGFAGPLSSILEDRCLNFTLSRTELHVRSPRSMANAVCSVRREVRATGVDVVIGNLPRGVIVSALAGPFTPRIALLHSPLGDDPISRLARRFATNVITNAEHTRAALRAQLPSSTIEVLTPVTQPPPSPDNPVVARDLVTMVSRFQRYKGHADFVNVCSELAAENPEQRFAIVGAVSGDDGEAFLTEVKHAIRVAGLENRLELFVNAPDSTVKGVLNRTLTLVHPAYQEDFGMVLIEALSAGCPVAAYASAGPSSIAENASMVTTVPIGDVRELSRVVGREVALMKVDSTRSLTARSEARRHHYGPQFAARCENLVRSLLAEVQTDPRALDA